ncbi:MAG: hypothetical protein IJ832_04890 [Bacteroidaceae bacterium]|nr:hypothetical protein [Bacteroidaceae bacterium]
MAIIKKLIESNGVTVYPRTISEAVVDSQSGEKLSEVLRKTGERLTRVEQAMPEGRISIEEIEAMAASGPGAD